MVFIPVKVNSIDIIFHSFIQSVESEQGDSLLELLSLPVLQVLPRVQRHVECFHEVLLGQVVFFLCWVDAGGALFLELVQWKFGKRWIGVVIVVGLCLGFPFGLLLLLLLQLLLSASLLLFFGVEEVAPRSIADGQPQRYLPTHQRQHPT